MMIRLTFLAATSEKGGLRLRGLSLAVRILSTDVEVVSGEPTSQSLETPDYVRFSLRHCPCQLAFDFVLCSSASVIYGAQRGMQRHRTLRQSGDLSSFTGGPSAQALMTD
ncbi:hypothetical protein BaRGS_00014351 [Batillaria attramentaria]|uniref:Uncharacterized protein n=1 Tax=Batillaria attramentaria TaxID=370345 RepID=A0ABD0L4G6_9CAEN